MAIKVQGTTVVDNSRNLTNIASVDATTVTAIGAAGVGGGGTHDFVASGAIANGDVVALNSDGTVSVVSASAGDPEAGTPVVYEAADTQTIAATFDSNSNKVVVVYMDNGNSSLCTAIVGTVS